MAYEIEIDGLVLPIPPSKIDTKIKGNTKTINLINDVDINVLRFPGLTEYSFDARLSYTKYRFSLNDLKPDVFLDKFEELMATKKPCRLMIKRTSYDGSEKHFEVDKKVSLEDYTIKEDAKDGLDIVVTLKFKIYRDYSTTIVEILEDKTAVIENQRNADSAPELKTYTVVKGDCLWNIAKKYLGDGRRYTEIYELNKDIIKNPNRIYVGQVLKMPNGATAPKTTTTTKKTQTPKKTTTSAKPKTVKISVSMSGAMGFTAMCYAEYVSGKVKKVGTFKANFTLNVDTDSNVSLTFRHTNGKMFKTSIVLSPVSIWKQEKGFTSVKLLCVANSDATASVIFQ